MLSAIRRRAHPPLLLGSVVMLAVLSTRVVRLNLSPSVPYGLYRVHAVEEPLTHNALVILPTPVSMRPWQRGWMPLLKPVAGVAGEQVCITDDGLWIERRWYGPVYQAAQGKALPRLRGCQQVGVGEVFLASVQPYSADSRYFGAVPIANLRAVATPLVTWR